MTDAVAAGRDVIGVTTGRAAAPTLPGWRHHYSGKVRDLYLPDDTLSDDTIPDDARVGAGHPAPDVVLVVASDRISAYDHVLSTPIPDKGAILTALSLWWFEQLADVVPNHLLPTRGGAEPGDVTGPDVPAEVADRAMLCRRLEMVPIECVARGYLAGSGIAEYRATGSVCGIELPDGLAEGSRLEWAIFTPATKAPMGEHDMNIDFAAAVDRIGEPTAVRVRELTLAVYRRAERIARDRGLVLADTKLEFGRPTGVGRDEHASADDLVLGDEVLTPDSSRFWSGDAWAPGGPQPSFDKQYVRDWLTSPSSGWQRYGGQPPPPLPDKIIARTRARYVEAYERLTGRLWR